MDLIEFLLNILDFLNSSVVPFLMALALLVFLYNIVRYFILGSADQEGREKAKSLALWGIVAFVIIVSFWGVVNVLTDDFGFSDPTAVCPDFVEDCSSYSSGSGGSGSAEAKCSSQGGTWQCVGTDPIQQICNCFVSPL